ncbi:MAG TPA: ImmA/IrrE family metallo-endopeptidase [Gaiellaceae bacterium]|nr:ImmA/IrrE family metallo-endopeptidase [Gaiellaceae bacterium]
MTYITTRTTESPSVLASLRGLAPERALAHDEALRVAELQANRLLGHFDVQATAVPEELITELPRIRVVRELLPVSGSAHWANGYWLISLNAAEPHVRQRFSLMHEFKHVLDHTRRHFPYYDRAWLSQAEQAERVADYFAACVLMPKKVVKSLWCSGQQDIPALAAKLQVSVPALRYRLAYLGLTEPASRCEQRSPLRPLPRRRAERTYFRPAVLVPALGGVA